MSIKRLIILTIVLIIIAAIGCVIYWLMQPSEIVVMFKQGVSAEDAVTVITNCGGGDNMITGMVPDPKPKDVEIMMGLGKRFLFEKCLQKDSQQIDHIYPAEL